MAARVKRRRLDANAKDAATANSNKQASSTAARQNSAPKTPAQQQLQNTPKQPAPKQTTPPQPPQKQTTPQQSVLETQAPEPLQSTPQQPVPKQPAPPSQPAAPLLQPAIQQPIPDNLSVLAQNRLAGKKIKLGIKNFQVSSTDPDVLLCKLLGPWDPVKSTYKKYEYMMAFMEGGIKARVGPPVYGVNLVECTREIQTAMTSILAGRPSEEVTSAIVVALFRVKPHVQKILQEKDPGTGSQSREQRLQKMEHFFAKLCTFCRNQEEHGKKKEDIKRQRDLWNRKSGFSNKLIGGVNDIRANAPPASGPVPPAPTSVPPAPAPAPIPPIAIPTPVTPTVPPTPIPPTAPPSSQTAAPVVHRAIQPKTFIPTNAPSASVSSNPLRNFSTAPRLQSNPFQSYFNGTAQSLHRRSEGIAGVYSVMKSQLEAEQSLLDANRQLIEANKRMIEAKEKNTMLLEKIKFLQEMIKSNRGDANVAIFQNKLNDLVQQL